MARLQRATPYIDKTIYVSWNSLLISAYLEASRVLNLPDTRDFALKSLDRILAEAWSPEAARLAHVIAYSDPQAGKRVVHGMLDDYAYTVIACLDAYESTSSLSYFQSARSIADAMIKRFFDATGGGFFDMDVTADPAGLLGALSSRRKPLQDSPTPAGHSSAIIALMRLYNYTNDANYKDKSEDTLEAFAGVVDHFGVFVATYGIGLRLFTTAHTQVVIVGSDSAADDLYAAAIAPFSLAKSVLRYKHNELTAQNLPTALADTIPHVPGVTNGNSVAIICSGFTCQPPMNTVEELSHGLKRNLHT